VVVVVPDDEEARLLFFQSITGWRVSNADDAEHRQPTQSYGRYLRSGHFAEATFENWESGFLQSPSGSLRPTLRPAAADPATAARQWTGGRARD
jgi:hypothetical protein